MLQVNIHAPGQFRLDQVPAPQAAAGEVVVQVRCCGICGSDLGYVAAGGLLGPSATPMPLGHELAGVVAEVGAGIEGLRVGDRVVLNPMAGDNMIGNGGPEGGFAPLLKVRNATLGNSLHHLPEALSFEQGALVEPLAVAMHAVNQSGARAGDRVAVCGAGPIGLGVVIALRYLGVTDIVALDLSDTRLERATRLGAAAVVNGSRDAFAELTRLHGAETLLGMSVPATDIYIDATGAGPVVEAIVTHARAGAMLVVVGLHKKPVPISLTDVLMRELTIRGAMGYPTEFPQVIEMLRSGEVDVTPMVSHRFRLPEFETAFGIASDANAAAKVLVDTSM